MKQIVVFPRGQLTPSDRKALSRAGVCVVEADDPTKVVTVLPSAPAVPADELLSMALASMTTEGYSTDIRKSFMAQWAAAQKRRLSSSPG